MTIEANNLCIVPDKCEWRKDRIEFPGYIISGDGVEMTGEYVRTLKEIQPVKPLKETLPNNDFITFALFEKLAVLHNASKPFTPSSTLYLISLYRCIFVFLSEAIPI